MHTYPNMTISRLKIRFSVMGSIVFVACLTAGPAGGQIRTADLLDQVKRAQKFLMGERPCGTPLTVKPEGWTPLLKGIQGRVLQVLPAGTERGVRIHVIRIDPRSHTIRVLRAEDAGSETATAKNFADRSGALAVINAGYFDKKFGPLGLLVADGVRRNRFVKSRGRASDFLYNGVLVVKGDHPHIRRKEDYRPSGENVAVQAGPLLIARGKPASSLDGLRDSRRLDGRTVLSLDGRGRIVLWVTASPLGGVNWCELRDMMLQYGDWEKEPGPSHRRGIRWALNLDGGTSAQLFVRRSTPNGKSIEVAGTPVPVALGFFPRN